MDLDFDSFPLGYPSETDQDDLIFLQSEEYEHPDQILQKAQQQEKTPHQQNHQQQQLGFDCLKVDTSEYIQKELDFAPHPMDDYLANQIVKQSSSSTVYLSAFSSLTNNNKSQQQTENIESSLSIDIEISNNSSGSNSNSQTPSNEKQKKARRHVEKGVIKRNVYSVQDVWNLVDKWRFTRNQLSLNFEQAAAQLKMSKKTLDDYYGNLKMGCQYGYDFAANQDRKFAHLRHFNQQKKAEQSRKK